MPRQRLMRDGHSPRPIGEETPQPLLGVQAARSSLRLLRAAPERMAPPLVLVLGMHRSGTSALAGLLVRLGGEGPRDAIGGNAGNPRGHFEPRRIVALHDALLSLDGQAWSDWSRLDISKFRSDRAERWMDRLAAIMRIDFTGERPMIVKDPRICRMVPLWRGVAARLGVGLRVVLAYRHPAEVVASLARRDAMPQDAAALAWLRHVLDAERETRDLPRVVVDYAELLEDWRGQVERIAAGLGIPFMSSGVAAVQADAFVSPALRRESAAGRAAEPLPAWLTEAMEALCDLRHDPFDPCAMRRLTDLDTGATPFGPALLEASHIAALYALEAARRDPMSVVRARLRARLTLWAARGGDLRWRAAGHALTLVQAIRRHA